MRRTFSFCATTIVAALALPTPLLAQTSSTRSVDNTRQAAPKAHPRNIASPTDQNSAGRVALVIGNARYERVPALRNAVKDARDICQALKGLQFQSSCV